MEQPNRRAAIYLKASWLLFPALVAVRIVLAALPLPWRVEMVLSDVLTYFLPMVLSIALAASASARGRIEIDEGRRFWRLLAVAIAVLLVSEIHFTYYTVAVDPAGPAYASFERLLHLVAIGIVFSLLVRTTRFRFLPLTQRLSFYLDVAAAVAVVWPLPFAFWVYPLIKGLPGGGIPTAAVAAAYSLFGLVMMAFTTLVAFGRRVHGRALWERVLALALWLYGLSLALSPVFLPALLTRPPSGSGWLTLAYGLGMSVLVVALVHRLFGENGALLPEPWPLPLVLSPRTLRYYPVVTAAALPALGFAALTVRHDQTAASFSHVTWLLATLLALRSWISSVERSAERRRLAEDSQTGLLLREVLDRRMTEVVEFSTEAGVESSFIVFDARRSRPLRARGLTRDALALAVAHLIVDLLPEGCEAFHVTSSRFAVILEGSGPEDAARYALKVCIAATKDRKLAGPQGASLRAGISCFPRDGVNPDMLLASAEVAASAAHAFDDRPVVVYGDDISALPMEERDSRERMHVQRRTVRALAQAVDARDPATRDHSSNVAELATGLARVLGLPDERVQVIGLGALMHDVGKIGIRDEVLLSGERLPKEARAEIEQHSVLGERILAPARLDEVLPLVRWHHERWDGDGYPDGLSGEEIPIEARIVGVCDAFETMTRGRPYEPARSVDDALDEIEACAGTQFDPAVASAFIRMVRALMRPVGKA